MKKINKVTIFVAVTVMVLSLGSCEDQAALPVNNTVEIEEGIPTFATQEDYDAALEKVHRMKLSELQVYENEMGYKSFGRICDEFYETIDPEQFTTQEEAILFIEENSKYLQLYIDAVGDVYCEPQDYSNAERYLMNEDRAYVIADSMYFSPSPETRISTIPPMQKSPSLGLDIETNRDKNETTFKRTIKVGVHHYRLRVTIELKPVNSGLLHGIEAVNYSRSLCIWWRKRYPCDGLRIEIFSNDKANVKKTLSRFWPAGGLDRVYYPEFYQTSYKIEDPYFTKVDIDISSFFDGEEAEIDIIHTY